MFSSRPSSAEESSNVMSLRDHLLAAQAASASGVDIHPSPSHDTQIDPQIGVSFSPSPVTPGMEPQNPEVRKGRRELSMSKRAAQNRAAQRAFRQRKEQYIHTLKSQVQNYEQMATNYKSLEKENLILREYIIQLQSRLLESGHRDMIPTAPPEVARGSAAPSSSVIPPPLPHNDELAAMERQLQASAAADDDSADEDMSLGAQLQEAAAAAARQIGRTAGSGHGPDKVD